MKSIKSFAEKHLENPNHPLLGPSLKCFQVIGMWRVNTSKLQNSFFNFLTIFEIFFVISELINLYLSRSDVSAIAQNLYLTCMTVVSVYKIITFVYWQKDWVTLTEGVAYEEIFRKENVGDDIIAKEYTAKARRLGFAYAIFVALSVIGLILGPILSVARSEELRIAISNGDETYPLLFDILWFPFDSTKPPGYILALLIQFTVSLHHGAVVMVFDTHAVALMMFLKGHLVILKEKCSKIFDGGADGGMVTREVVLERIKECHRHHNHLVALHRMFDSLLSPIMFMYVLVCSVTICCCVIQLTLVAGQTSEKMFLQQFIFLVISQLFLYCWHSSEVTYQSEEVAKGVYESEWWRGDVRTRKLVMLLGSKLSQPFIFNAGPFTILSVGTFVEILKASYSFYTFLTQMN